MADKASKIDPKLVDELLKDQGPKSVLRSDGLLGDLKKALAERMLDAEMDVHLASEEEQAAGNHRNGRSGKRVLTDSGAIPLSIPRDRHGRFDPKLIEKYKRRFPELDDKIVAMYARGMSTRDIPALRYASPIMWSIWFIPYLMLIELVASGSARKSPEELRCEVLEAGMSTSEVIAVMGEPYLRFVPSSNNEQLEVWIYRRSAVFSSGPVNLTMERKDGDAIKLIRKTCVDLH